uniref:Cell division protein n=1 Tax=Tydemania expeditionis TaxID=325645 RepID=A0A0D6E2S2_TYDEX|nr:cell division protein [Tydemania expeditionis]CEO91072.1 cell division protein [Tydemania expeditionis]
MTHSKIKQRNQLKLLLILNDFYKILCFFRTPFLKIGNKTAQQLTNLPFFLSFVFLSLGILQISLQNHNREKFIFRNYPLFSFSFSQPKIPKKFETFYLQLFNPQKISSEYLHNFWQNPRKKLFNEQGEQQKLLLDYFHYYFPDKKPEYPTTFEHIYEENIKKETINIYKNFEQIGPILFSELLEEEEEEKNKEKNKFKTIKDGQPLLIHLRVDRPIKQWSAAKNRNFDPDEDERLTSWKFPDTDLVIQDLKKKKNHLDKGYKEIKKYLYQYKNYEKLIKNAKNLNLNLLGTEYPLKIKIIQDKICIETQSWEGQKTSFLAKCFWKPLYLSLYVNNIHIFPFSPYVFPLKSTFPQKLRKIRKPKSPKFIFSETRVIPRHFYPNKKLSRYFFKEKSLSEVLLQRIHLVSGAKLAEMKRKGKKVDVLKNFKNKKFTRDDFLQILTQAVDIGDVDNSDLPERLGGPITKYFKELKSVKKQIKRGKRLLSTPSISKYSKNFFYQLEKIHDQIPRRLQGFKSSQLPIPQTKWTLSYLLDLENLEENNYESWSPEYEKQRYEEWCYPRATWENLYKKLSNLSMESPRIKEIYNFRENQYIANKKSLLNIKFVNPNEFRKPERERDATILLKFIELLATKTNIVEYKNYFETLQKFNLKYVKYLVDFDIEVHKVSNKNIKIHKKKAKKGKKIKKNKYILKIVNDLYLEDQKNKLSLEYLKFIFEQSEDIITALFKLLPSRNFYDHFFEPEFLTPERVSENLDFMLWREREQKKREASTIDHYQNISSSWLELQEKNHYLKQIITAEDYLIEAISLSLQKNTLAEKLKEMSELEEFIEDAPIKNTEEEDTDSTEDDYDYDYAIDIDIDTEIAIKTSNKIPLRPSDTTILILNFFTNKREKKNLFFEKNNRFLQMKYLFEKKRNIELSFFWNNLFEKEKDNEIFKEQLKSTTLEFLQPKEDQSLLENKNPIIDPWLKKFSYKLKNEIFSSLRLTPQLNKIFNWEFIKNNYWSNDQLQNFIVHWRDRINTPEKPIFHIFKDNLEYQLLWLKKHFFPKQKQIQLELDLYLQNINENLEENSDISDILSERLLPKNEKMFKYFRQKLPRIPKHVNLDRPFLSMNDNDPFIKEKNGIPNYPYNVETRPTMDEEKRKIIELVKDIVSILKNWNKSLNIPRISNKNFNYFYNLFYYKMNEKLMKDFYYHDEINDKQIFQKEIFEKTMDEILQILKTDDIFKLKPQIKKLNKPIYQTVLVRKMSGYIYPDIQTIKLPKFSSKKIIEIPIPKRNIEISKFVENFPKLDLIQPSKPKILENKYKILKYKRKLSTKDNSERESEFFDFRENFNLYSWSILFFLSSSWVFINIFKNVYKKYAKEIVESCIDFLNRAGILDDVQWLKQELGLTRVDKGYRGIRHQGKKLKNIIGLDRKHIILQVSEMVWFLKTKKLIQSTDLFVYLFFLLNESFSKIQIHYKKQIIKPEIINPYLKPKGFLLAGPPGTGKTLLVQAIAGETGVPVVTQSGGLLQNPRLRGRGAKTLHKLFVRGREISPCIIFIDEVDGIGARRQFLPLYISGGYDPIAFLDSFEAFSPPQPYKTKLQRRSEYLDDTDPYWKEPEFTQIPQSTQIPIDVLQEMEFSRGARNEQLNILTQLLIELDGIHSLDNILVIGATNRLEILDPALMRPGRFQRILQFTLPDSTARLNLLKLYTKASKIGVERISWDYFSKRTHGFSSADIASIVFASELIAVQQSQKHTFETLERGIDLITSFPSDPGVFRLKNIFLFLEKLNFNFFLKNGFYSLNSEIDTSKYPNQLKTGLTEISNILRNCYYNIGKLLILFCLQTKPLPISYINLWERPKNFRFVFFTKNFNEFSEFDQKRLSRQQIERKFMSFFGGKAAESIFIFSPLNKFSTEIYFSFNKQFISMTHCLEQSNFGIETEIQTAQNLLKLMVEKWYFYMEKIATEKFHPIFESSNLQEYYESEKEVLIFQALVDEMIIDLDMRNRLSINEQKQSYKAWWMKKITTRLNYRENSYHLLSWSRIYLSNPESSIQNIEWVTPDDYFHTLLRTPPYCMAWTHFLENGRFAISNLLLLQSFNTVFQTLRQFSEFLDFISDYFLRYECLRENEFYLKIDQFYKFNRNFI